MASEIYSIAMQMISVNSVPFALLTLACLSICLSVCPFWGGSKSGYLKSINFKFPSFFAQHRFRFNKNWWEGKGNAILLLLEVNDLLQVCSFIGNVVTNICVDSTVGTTRMRLNHRRTRPGWRNGTFLLSLRTG